MSSPAVNGVAILLDSSPRSWGTREEFHLRLCRALRSQGFCPVLAHSEELPADVKDRFVRSGAVVITLNHRRGDYLTRLGPVVKEHRIALAHVRFFDYFSVVPWLLRLRGIRYVVFTDANGGEWEARRFKKHLVRTRARLACWPLARVIAISNFVRDRLVSVGIEAERIAMVHNGVDLERFVPDPSGRSRLAADYPLAPDELVVTTVGSLLPIKHVDVVLRACATLMARGVPFRLFVAGEGPLRHELEKLGVQLGMADRVHWLGYLPDATTLLQSTDVFVLASVGEAFGNVLAEAMACGVPVVASRSGGIGEVIEDAATGYLVPPRTPEAFADAIERLGRNRELRHVMSSRAIERVRRMFNVDRTVEETMRVYQSILGEARP